MRHTGGSVSCVLSWLVLCLSSPAAAAEGVPETQLDATPDAVTAATTAAFAFSNPLDPTHTNFECQLDAAGWSPCSGPDATARYPFVPPGRHTFLVRAVGAEDSADPTPAYFAWRVDPSVPETTIQLGPTDPAQRTDATFVFDANVTDPTYRCALNPSAGVSDETFPVCPEDSTFTGLTEGRHTLSVYVVDDSGVRDETPATWTWTLDTSRPDTLIQTGPPLRSAETSATFTFVASIAEVTTFACRLDDGPWSACNGGTVTFSALTDGTHLAEVRAVDGVGRSDPAPARHRWTVDTVAPVVTVASGPANPAQTGTASFVLTADESPVTYRCAVGDGVDAPLLEGYAPCSATPVFTGLAAGDYTLHVLGTDDVGNATTTAATWGWTFDPSRPETIISAGPEPLVADGDDAVFTFVSNGAAGVGFECRLDDGSWSPCDSGAQTYLGADLAVGDHVFAVRACTDACDPTPATWVWTVSPSACPHDTDVPFLFCPPDVTLECVDGGAVLPSPLEATATDPCGVSVSSSTRTSVFLGENPVPFVATDGNGNTASCLAVITVADRAPPIMSCAANVTVSAASDRCGATVLLDPWMATDACQSEATLEVDDPGQTQFPVGTTAARVDAVDDAGNAEFCLTRVTVEDDTAPVVDCPASVTREADPSLCAWAGELIASATDNCAVVKPPAPVDGAFPVGETSVDFTATDAAGHIGRCTSVLAVSDSEDPEVHCVVVPDGVTASATDNCGATLTLWVAECVLTDATGAVTELGGACPVTVGPQSIRWDGTPIVGESLAIQVTAEAVDVAGASAQTSCVRVLDGVPPVVMLPTTDDGGCTAGSAAGGTSLGGVLLALWLLLSYPARRRPRNQPTVPRL